MDSLILNKEDVSFKYKLKWFIILETLPQIKVERIAGNSSGFIIPNRVRPIKPGYCFTHRNKLGSGFKTKTCTIYPKISSAESRTLAKV